jgi:phospholipase/carboxylesterase
VLEAIVTEPAVTANASVLWLHGLGANGHDFADLTSSLGLPENHGIRFIFPHAPEQPVSLNGGRSMPAWYDILGVSFGSAQDAQGIRRAEQWVREWLDHEQQQGIPSNRLFVGGFSQGGALALHSGLRYFEPLGGIIALSTYLPLADTLEKEGAPNNKKIPIWMAHGTFDPVVSFDLGQYSYQHLSQLGYAIYWHTYPMLHTVCQEELQKIGQWLREQLKIS